VADGDSRKLRVPLHGDTAKFHITSFNEWYKDTQLEPSVVTDATSADTSPTGMQYTLDLLYQCHGTTYLDTLRSGISAANH